MPKPLPAPSPEITVSEVAELMGVDRKTVLRWIDSGQVEPTRKLPGRTGTYLLDRTAIERLAAERDAS